MAAGPLASLRRLARPEESEERCELCSAPIAAEHRHLLEVETEALACACQACALLFTGREHARYRPVPTRVLSLPDLVVGEDWWESLDIPVGLAFFARSTRQGRVVARYPSPAGPTESRLGLDTWVGLEASNPVLRDLQPDVEALLVNRVGTAADNLIVPIDQCYALVGLVRSHWRGISGGPEVWGAIATYFGDLRQRARAVSDA